MSYEKKFAGLIKVLKEDDAEVIVVNSPDVLGDTHAELIESLSRIAESGKQLAIVGR